MSALVRTPTPITNRCIRLLPKQYRFVTTSNRYKCYSGGVRSGKTYAGVVLALLLSSIPGNRGLIGAQTYRQLKDTTMRTFFDLCPPELIHPYHKSDNILTFRNGSEILVRTLDDESKLRGHSLGWFWIDEAEAVKESIFRQLSYRLDYKGAPSQHGIITTNPGGFGHWVYRMMAQGGVDNALFIETSSLENRRNLPESFIKDLNHDEGSDWYNRYVLGRWGAWSGQVYKEFSRTVHILPTDWQPDWEHMQFYRSIDWGYNNPFVCLWVAKDSDNRLYVYDEHVQREMLVADHARIILARYPGKWFNRTYYDPSGAEPAAQMQKAGLKRLWPGNNDVWDGIQHVKEFLSKGKDGRPSLYIHPRCTHTIQELESYQWDSTKDGANREEPLKEHDHCMDALRYLIHTRFLGKQLVKNSRAGGGDD
jgi:phage terminase large subunit